ncbi:MAG: TerB family tellurite resistance protein, partial [Flavobacteriales bacterium]
MRRDNGSAQTTLKTHNMGFGKWLGGALGWAVGGPIGGIIGFALGAIADDKSTSGVRQSTGPQSQNAYGQHRHQTRPGDFASALLVLSAAVMKADNKLLKSELDYIREFYSRQFGSAMAAQHIGVLKELLQKEIPVREVCEQIRYNMEHPMRLQLMYYLFGIAQADGNVDKSEVRMIESIAGYLGLNNKDIESLKAMYYKDSESAYKILEIESTCTDEEVKKAYRRMAMKY